MLVDFGSLAKISKAFDRWKAHNDPRLAIWGTNLSEHRKATLVEVLLCQNYGQQIIVANAPAQLAALLKTLLVPRIKILELATSLPHKLMPLGIFLLPEMIYESFPDKIN